jgi:hypothetical protein
MGYFVYVQYREEGIPVAKLLVEFNNFGQSKEEEYNGWKRLTQKLPLTFFVHNPDVQFEVLIGHKDAMPVDSDTIRISLVY